MFFAKCHCTKKDSMVFKLSSISKKDTAWQKSLQIVPTSFQTSPSNMQSTLIMAVTYLWSLYHSSSPIQWLPTTLDRVIDFWRQLSTIIRQPSSLLFKDCMVELYPICLSMGFCWHPCCVWSLQISMVIFLSGLALTIAVVYHNHTVLPYLNWKQAYTKV